MGDLEVRGEVRRVRIAESFIVSGGERGDAGFPTKGINKTAFPHFTSSEFRQGPRWTHSRTLFGQFPHRARLDEQQQREQHPSAMGPGQAKSA